MNEQKGAEDKFALKSRQPLFPAPNTPRRFTPRPADDTLGSCQGAEFH